MSSHARAKGAKARAAPPSSFSSDYRTSSTSPEDTAKEREERTGRSPAPDRRSTAGDAMSSHRTRKRPAAPSRSPSLGRPPRSRPKSSAVKGYARSRTHAPSSSTVETPNHRIRQTRASAAEDLRVENESLREELQNVARRLEEAKKENSTLQAQHRDELEQVQILARENEQGLRDDLARSAKDLSRLRSLTKGAGADAQALLILFDEINDEVANFAFRLVKSFSLGERTVNEICIYAHEQSTSAMASNQYLDSFLSCAEKRGCFVGDTLVLAIQASLLFHLQSQVFLPFFPGFQVGGDDVNTHLKRLEDAVQSQECQGYSARWRAMTYNALAARPDEEFPVRFTDQLLNDLQALFSAFDLDSTIVKSETLPAQRPSHDVIFELVSKAIQWQHQARTAHFDYDYRPFLPAPGDDFKPDEMEREQWPWGGTTRNTNRRPREVTLPLALGLEATRVENDSETMTRVRKVLRKPRVL